MTRDPRRCIRCLQPVSGRRKRCEQCRALAELAKTTRRRQGRIPHQRTYSAIIGRTFDSKGECARAETLWAEQQAGRISNLRFQTSFPIAVNGQKVCTYRADFTYLDGNGDAVVEDFKGVRTDVYKLKRRLLKAAWGIEILETEAA